MVRMPSVVRSPDEEHRTATSLELFFDLCFVVAVAQAAAELHHEIAERHFADGILGFVMLFTAVWWGWMNFTWFASAHDADDVPYRLLTFLQMTGALVVAAGVHDAFVDDAFGTVVAGYVIMRLAQIVQWLRVAHDQPSQRARALWYGYGFAVVQVLWVVWVVFTPDGAIAPLWVVLIVADLSVPWIAEHRMDGPRFHAEHIVERYGLFTLIVLGESILAATIGVQQAIAARGLSFEILAVAVGGLVIVFSVWWIYFTRPGEPDLSTDRKAFGWGYGHLPLFGGLAAFGAGVQVGIDALDPDMEVTTRVGALAVTIPIAVAMAAMLFVASVTGAQEERRTMPLSIGAIAVSLLLGFVASVPVAVLGTAAAFAALVAIKVAVLGVARPVGVS